MTMASPIQAVAAMLGHARLSTSQIYTRVSPVTGKLIRINNKSLTRPGPELSILRMESADAERPNGGDAALTEKRKRAEL